MGVREEQALYEGGAHSQSVRLAHMLALPEPAQVSEVDLARAVTDGLFVGALEVVAQLIRAMGKMAVHSVVSASTISRAKRRPDKRLSRETSERIYKIAQVYDEAMCAYNGDKQLVIAFMTSPNQTLKGKAPIEVASSSTPGADAVINLLRQARAGVAV
ncbi:MAG: DUF2384 domain-containing protein [Maricaulaceae bacterium]|nr:DUF2384 domain-containing protein [Maricaulaceae bacterium]